MNMPHSISRRSLLRAAPAAAVVSALPAMPAIADEPENLLTLARRFAREAEALDPTIIGSFVGTDELMEGPIEARVHGVFLSRRSEVAHVRHHKPQPSRMERAIKAHKAAWDRFGETVNGADEVHPDYRGKAGEAAWERAGRGEDRALLRLLRIVGNGHDAQVRATYLRKMIAAGNISLQDRHWDTLLRSTAGVL